MLPSRSAYFQPIFFKRPNRGFQGAHHLSPQGEASKPPKVPFCEWLGVSSRCFHVDTNVYIVDVYIDKYIYI